MFLAGMHSRNASALTCVWSSWRSLACHRVSCPLIRRKHMSITVSLFTPELSRSVAVVALARKRAVVVAVYLWVVRHQHQRHPGVQQQLQSTVQLVHYHVQYDEQARDRIASEEEAQFDAHRVHICVRTFHVPGYLRIVGCLAQIIGRRRSIMHKCWDRINR